jgi:hypothetical protein
MTIIRCGLPANAGCPDKDTNTNPLTFFSTDF